MEKRILALSFIFLIFWHCSTAPKPRQVQNTFSLDASFDKTWVAVIEVFAVRNLSIATLEKDSGIIISEWITLSKELDHYYDCGSSSPFPLDIIRVKFNVFARSLAENSSDIKINALFRSGDKECVSTGNFERELFDLIKTKIN